jgi:hypothetical protein
VPGVGVAVEDVAVGEVRLHGAEVGAVGRGEGRCEGAGDRLAHCGVLHKRYSPNI